MESETVFVVIDFGAASRDAALLQNPDVAAVLELTEDGELQLVGDPSGNTPAIVDMWGDGDSGALRWKLPSGMTAKELMHHVAAWLPILERIQDGRGDYADGMDALEELNDEIGALHKPDDIDETRPRRFDIDDRPPPKGTW